jgi:uncharacterized protein YbaR (Trm112 family)
MTKFLLDMLIDPISKEKLKLKDEQVDKNGNIKSGILYTENISYPIINAIPRFAGYEKVDESVESFGNQWNRFNFEKFKMHWLEHTMKNSFDNGVDDIKDKVVIDAGGVLACKLIGFLKMVLNM